MMRKKTLLKMYKKILQIQKQMNQLIQKMQKQITKMLKIIKKKIQQQLNNNKRALIKFSAFFDWDRFFLQNDTVPMQNFRIFSEKGIFLNKKYI